MFEFYLMFLQMMALLSERNEEITRIRDGDFARERGKVIKRQLQTRVRGTFSCAAQSQPF